MSTSTSFASSFPSSTPAADPFAARHHKSLPRELRTEAAGMTWSAFENTYAPSNGPFRLGSWSEQKTGPGMWDFAATLGIGESICKTGASAPGPVAAMTSMLYDAGCPMEILSFHQHEIGHRTATFLLCESVGIRLWAMGIGESHTESTLRAMISGANRLCLA
ncbi:MULTISPECIES: 2-isopropylmalate synthase [unclassified Rhodococcus (in: high G+C Gram-positive bacteria)]|uniref:2-isopropylmalate synthase n=1 Tax=unclassified Rhodococcus (in: high G+C Gram-positive bacteria) TaxID=192944 RepID=UPI00163AD25B|nr:MULTISPECIES: 2-isopropylmalate synthase [unclassified Rhodococcus (in: high G+C Gram-positive bacteria)]MBC2643972.1 2-isopropylmalate synthase [Rhodococcus sp. 3A]MBC2891289.1 2-isopropylmalate synthase [Rhodococcus sp. 4CII]